MSTLPRYISHDYLEGSFDSLPLAGERTHAALHFSYLIDSTPIQGSCELARSHLRASLSEFRSIFDLLNADFKAKRLLTQWKRSRQKTALDAEPIVSVLRKVRDFAIHSSSVQGVPKTHTVLVAPTFHCEETTRIFIEPLDRTDLELRRELSDFTDEALLAFNSLSMHSSACDLIGYAIFRASKPLAAFLKVAEPDGV